VPRHIRIVQITTFGLGTAISNTLIGSARQGFTNSSLYGNPAQETNQRIAGDGLRTYYTWGLWNECAGYNEPSKLQYCTRTRWAHRFEPTSTLLRDVPTAYASTLANLLSDEARRIKSDHYLGDWSQTAFYFLAVGVVLLAFMIVAVGGSSSGRGANCAALGLNLIVLVCMLVGTLIWTSIIAILKHRLRGQTVSGSNGVPLGIEAEYGNALWILWAIDAILIVCFVPYCLVSKIHWVTPFGSRLYSSNLFFFLSFSFSFFFGLPPWLSHPTVLTPTLIGLYHRPPKGLKGLK
ncbi:hypothetical protein CROQUDRAFT_40982, partial [Cronartium quercuum f. sp. fusiforme G11]